MRERDRRSGVKGREKKKKKERIRGEKVIGVAGALIIMVWKIACLPKRICD